MASSSKPCADSVAATDVLTVAELAPFPDVFCPAPAQASLHEPENVAECDICLPCEDSDAITDAWTSTEWKAPPGVPGASPAQASLEELKEVPDCAICLETGDTSVKMVLACGHVFCRSCISQHVAVVAERMRRPRCPQCSRDILEHELAACLPDEALDRLLRGIGDAAGTDGAQESTAPEAPEELQAFRQLAEQEHLKCCPGCRAPIEKTGGCDHMSCRCGRFFNWSEAPTVVPCSCVHRHPRYGVWGATCPGCTWQASAKLAARRTGLVVFGTVGVVAAGAVAVVVLAVGGPVVLVVKVAKWSRRSQDESEVQRNAARRRYEEAQIEIEFASIALRREEAKWFNWTAVEAAQRRLQQRRAHCRRCRDALEQLEPGDIDSTAVGMRNLLCCSSPSHTS